MRRAVQEPEGFGITRRQLLGLGGMAAFVAFAAACGTTTTGGGTSTAVPTASNTLAGKPLESKLQIYNWSQYDAASTYTKFENLPAEKAAGLNIHETYYSSNDELLAKLNAGAGGYDIIAPSQNAVAQLIQEGKLMALDQSLLPNLKYLDPKFLKVSYDPTGQYHVIKDYGITMFFYNNKIITEQPKTMKDFYDLLNKYVSKGRTNLLDGAEEVVPLALMALGLDPEHERPERPRSGQAPSCSPSARASPPSVRPTTSTTGSPARSSWGRAGTATSDGSSRDARPRATSRQSSRRRRRRSGRTTGASRLSAPHPVAAHAWINWLLTPSTAVSEMNYHNYPIPIPSALAQMPACVEERPRSSTCRPRTPTTTSTS